MRRTKTGVLPSVDAMEPRLLLSTAAPLLSRHALTGVVREVRAIVSTLAKTGNTVQASGQLTDVASQIPTGSAGLALSWQTDLGLYRPHSARSVMTTETRIISDLYRDIQGGVASGNLPASGSGSTTSTTPIQGTGSTSLLCPRPRLRRRPPRARRILPLPCPPRPVSTACRFKTPRAWPSW